MYISAWCKVKCAPAHGMSSWGVECDKHALCGTNWGKRERLVSTGAGGGRNSVGDEDLHRFRAVAERFFREAQC